MHSTAFTRSLNCCSLSQTNQKTRRLAGVGKLKFRMSHKTHMLAFSGFARFIQFVGITRKPVDLEKNTKVGKHLEQ